MISFVFGTPLGAGGLGIQGANALSALVGLGMPVHAFGPGVLPATRGDVRRAQGAPSYPRWSRLPILRRGLGLAQLQYCRRLGRWAATAQAAVAVRGCYAFTQVGLESMVNIRDRSGVAVLESPNGHIRNFRNVYVRESDAFGVRFLGHPAEAMVDRVEEEYETAAYVRVSSEWSRRSLVEGGVPAHKVIVLPQTVDLERYRPHPVPGPLVGPLRIVYVGSLDLRKGFVYLLEALQRMGPGAAVLTVVGATGDPLSRRLWRERSGGLSVATLVGDPLPAYHDAEVFVLPSLEDGSPFAVAEAMACGLPVVTTTSCGAAEWIREGRSGWLVPPRDADALAHTLSLARDRRPELRGMGLLARLDTESRADPASCHAIFRSWAIRTFGKQ